MSQRGLRHTAADVTHWSYFLIDVDPVHEKCSSPDKAMDKTLMWLTHWTGQSFSGVNTPIIIDSGRGMQAWIRLDDIVLADHDGVIKLEHLSALQAKWSGKSVFSRSTVRRTMGHWLKKLNEYLALDHGCKVDTSVSDLPRVMRLPGSVNLKTGRTAKLINATEIVYTGLAETLISLTPPEVFIDPVVPSGLVKGQRWQKVFPHLTRTAQDYLTKGQEEPGRHKVMWHSAKKLEELGVTREEARRALRRANKLRGEDERLPDDQVEHALDTAYGGPVE
jgi:hypothetical protein